MEKAGQVHETVKSSLADVWCGQGSTEVMLEREPFLERLEYRVRKFRPGSCIFCICLSRFSLNSIVIDELQKRSSITPLLTSMPPCHVPFTAVLL